MATIGITMKRLVAALLICIAALAVSGCASGERIALRVDGQELPAAVLEDYIDTIKDGLGSDTDAAFETYVSQLGESMEEWWNDLLDFYGKEMVATQRCDELGIYADEEELEEMRRTYWAFLGVTDEAQYPQRLADAGLDETEVDARFTFTIRVRKLYEREVPKPDVTEEEIQVYADAHDAEYEAVSYRYLYMEAGNLAQMQDILKRLKEDPEADFEELALEYSQSPSVQQDAGDSGWTLTANVDPRILEVLDALDDGQWCEDVFVLDDELYILQKLGDYDPSAEENRTADGVNLAKMPESVKTSLKADVIVSVWNEACECYIQDLYDQADVEILIPDYYDLYR